MALLPSKIATTPKVEDSVISAYQWWQNLILFVVHKYSLVCPLHHVQPRWSGYRSAEYGSGLLQILGPSTAKWTWKGVFKQVRAHSDERDPVVKFEFIRPCMLDQNSSMLREAHQQRVGTYRIRGSICMLCLPTLLIRVCNNLHTSDFSCSNLHQRKYSYSICTDL